MSKKEAGDSQGDEAVQFGVSVQALREKRSRTDDAETARKRLDWCLASTVEERLKVIAKKYPRYVS